jgi:hypothetical protein
MFPSNELINTEGKSVQLKFNEIVWSTSTFKTPTHTNVFNAN